MMRDAENAESSVAAFEHVVAHLLANFPSTIATALKVAKRLSLNIAFADSIEKSLVNRQADLKGKTAIIYNLVALEVQQRKYMALGETTQGRLEKDPQLVVTKALVRATKLALPTSDTAKATLENHDNRNLVTVSYNLATVSGRVRRANLLEFDTHVCFLMVT